MTNAPPPPNWNTHAPALVAPLGPPAGFWIRVVATLIDWIIIVFLASLLVGVIAGAVFASGASAAREIAAGIGILIGIFGLIALSWLCEAIMTSSPRGAMFGKRAIGARIVHADGAPLSFGRATARHFAKALITPLVPLGFGFLIAAWTAGKRAIHDMICDTLVIRVN